ncbi:MAG: hydrogenase maturation protease [Caldilineaceae bacterium]
MPHSPSTLIIGCGNLLRGDDGVGPLLIRHLWERDLPAHVQLADGGTAGMDVAFKMRGAERVILIDACRSGNEPGTLYRLPGEAVEQLPPLDGIHQHAFRWDHALAFARWLLKDEYPKVIQVYLIEIASVEPGIELSPPVAQAMERLINLLLEDVNVWQGAGCELQGGNVTL